ncbi:MAG: HIT domain-containing protein [Calditrichaeota bacterium]|nr:MAG: HIT domain-containing protein [Calditrichota bacterium]
MEYLWAPWRMEYILAPKAEGCIFCSKPAESKDRDHLIIRRGQQSFIILNYYPYNNGHLMIVPYRHVSRLYELTAAEQREMMEFLAESSKILTDFLRSDGLNIGMNLGKTAGAGIDDHLHFHIVPRWNGDTNFMPIFGHTKVLPQGLFELYDQLYPLFQSPGRQLVAGQ